MATLVRWEPFRDIAQMQSEMGRLFDGLFEGRGRGSESWVPALDVWETPGHCDGHLSFLIRGGDRTYLLGADLVFWGGRVLLQNIHDCRIDAYAASVAKAAALDFDALLPGHLQISLRGGKQHVDQAAAAFRQLGVPPNLM